MASTRSSTTTCPRPSTSPRASWASPWWCRSARRPTRSCESSPAPSARSSTEVSILPSPRPEHYCLHFRSRKMLPETVAMLILATPPRWSFALVALVLASFCAVFALCSASDFFMMSLQQHTQQQQLHQGHNYVLASHKKWLAAGRKREARNWDWPRRHKVTKMKPRITLNRHLIISPPCRPWSDPVWSRWHFLGQFNSLFTGRTTLWEPSPRS